MAGHSSIAQVEQVPMVSQSNSQRLESLRGSAWRTQTVHVYTLRAHTPSNRWSKQWTTQWWPPLMQFPWRSTWEVEGGKPLIDLAKSNTPVPLFDPALLKSSWVIGRENSTCLTNCCRFFCLYLSLNCLLKSWEIANNYLWKSRTNMIVFRSILRIEFSRIAWISEDHSAIWSFDIPISGRFNIFVKTVQYSNAVNDLMNELTNTVLSFQLNFPLKFVYCKRSQWGAFVIRLSSNTHYFCSMFSGSACVWSRW